MVVTTQIQCHTGVGASPPSQLSLLKGREGILVNEPRGMEFSKDRLNQVIRGLLRENSLHKNALFLKDKEIIVLKDKLAEADGTIDTLSVILGAVLLMSVVGFLFAVTQWR